MFAAHEARRRSERETPEAKAPGGSREKVVRSAWSEIAEGGGPGASGSPLAGIPAPAPGRGAGPPDRHGLLKLLRCWSREET